MEQKLKTAKRACYIGFQGANIIGVWGEVQLYQYLFEYFCFEQVKLLMITIFHNLPILLLSCVWQYPII